MGRLVPYWRQKDHQDDDDDHYSASKDYKHYKHCQDTLFSDNHFGYNIICFWFGLHYRISDRVNYTGYIRVYLLLNNHQYLEAYLDWLNPTIGQHNRW